MSQKELARVGVMERIKSGGLNLVPLRRSYRQALIALISASLKIP